MMEPPDNSAHEKDTAEGRTEEEKLDDVPGPVDPQELTEKLQALAENASFEGTLGSAEGSGQKVAPPRSSEDLTEDEDEVEEEGNLYLVQDTPQSSEESELEDTIRGFSDPLTVIYGNVKVQVASRWLLKRREPENTTLQKEILKEFCMETVPEIILPKGLRLDVESYYWERSFHCPKCPGEFSCTCNMDMGDVITKLVSCFDLLVLSDNRCTICLQITDILRKRNTIFCQVNIDNQEPTIREELRLFVERSKDSCIRSRIQDHWSHEDQDENCAEILLEDEKIQLPVPDYLDIIVIGANSAALAICEEAEPCGLSVGIIDVGARESSPLRGFLRTDAGYGMALKRFLLDAAQVREKLKIAKFCCIEDTGEGVSLDWANLRLNALRCMSALAWKRSSAFMNRGVLYIAGNPRMVDRNTVQVECRQGTMTLHGKYFVYAPECELVYQHFPGLHRYSYRMHSILSYRSLEFSKTLVYGSKVSTLEYGGIFSSLGFQVTIMMDSKLHPKYDEDMIGKLREHLMKNGVEFVDECRIRSVMPVPRSSCGGSSIPNVMEKFMVIGEYVKTGEYYRGYFDNVIAIPNVEPHHDLKYGLEEIGVKFTKYNPKLVEVDRCYRTSVPNIYAVGTNVPGLQDPTKTFEDIGQEIVKNLSRNENFFETVDTKFHKVCTPVRYAFYGLSESIARTCYENVVVYHSSYEPTELALVPADQRMPCFIKLICHKVKTAEGGSSEVILGVHVIGHQATTIVSGYSVALSEGLTKEMLDDLLGIDFTSAAALIKMNKIKGTDDEVSLNEGCCA